MKIASLIVIGLLFAPAVALSQESAFSGNNMVKPCKDSLIPGNIDDVIQQGVCMDMINTVYFFSSVLPDTAKFCPQKGASVAQAAKIVPAYTDNHPELLHNDYRILALTALKLAWPCS